MAAPPTRASACAIGWFDWIGADEAEGLVLATPADATREGGDATREEATELPWSGVAKGGVLGARLGVGLLGTVVTGPTEELLLAYCSSPRS